MMHPDISESLDPLSYLPERRADVGFSGGAEKKVWEIADPFGENFSRNHRESGCEDRDVAVALNGRLRRAFKITGDCAERRFNREGFDHSGNRIVALKISIIIHHHDVIAGRIGDGDIERREKPKILMRADDSGL